MTTPPGELRIDRSTVVAIAGLVAVGIYLALLSFAMARWPYDRWMLLILIPVLLTVGGLIIWRVTRGDEVPLTRLIMLALVLKMAAAFVRHTIIFDVYASGDAFRYYNEGTRFADAFHAGQLPLSALVPTETGTPFVEHLTGLAYTMMGPTRLGGFVLFSWVAFWGLFLFHRAALIGLPEANQRRYAVLLFFLPSLLFWPSSIGKEAVIMLALGASAYGAARFLERRPSGWVPMLAGWGLAYFVRPHVAALLVAAFAVAVVLRRRGRRPPVFGPAARLLMVGGLVLVTSFVLGQAVDRYLPDDQISSDSGSGATASSLTQVGALFDRATSGTDQGGSVIESVVPTNPLDYPYAAFTVLFRPTLFEISSVTALFAALETTLLVVLFATSIARLKNLPVLALARPYLLMAMTYSGVFIFAWSSFANLGALARQRVQLWPFLLLLLALPVALESRKRPPPGASLARRAVEPAQPASPAPLR